MESITKKADQDKKREAEIKRQIAALQSLLPPGSPKARTPSPQPQTKRKRETTLAPPTPSPKKKRKTEESRQNASKPEKSGPRKPTVKQPELAIKELIPSNVLSKLAKTNVKGIDDDQVPPPERSTSLAAKAIEQVGSTSRATRDENLIVIEDLEPGPYDHHAPFDDPNFEKLEPNSGIKLSSRSLPHEDLQEHLTGRYYLSPSRLYSCVRLLPDKHGYDVPVPGDWLTIAVVAERGPLKYTKAPIPLEPDDHPGKFKGKGKQTEEQPKPSGKKYVMLRLIDFGTSARSKSSATGGKAVIRGDASLSLLLFEANSFDTVTTEGSTRTKKIYKGGSGGAFESLSKCKEGDVIVILNPRIMKPQQGTTQNPHPQNNILGLTPESAESIKVIGRASDLGLCVAIKRDGSRCNSWYDKRVSHACEYHVQETVKRARAARPEFSIGTTGMSNNAKKRKAAYDPARQWGLKPEAEQSVTYVVSGHVVKPQDLHVAENMGREAQAKAQRMRAKDADKMLKSLLERDKDGMKAVVRAREVMQEKDKVREQEKEKQNQGKAQKGKEKDKKKPKLDMFTAQTNKRTIMKNSFTAEVVKQLGFDPTVKPGQRREDTDEKLQSKLNALSMLQSSRKTIDLGRRPGTRAPVYFDTERKPANAAEEEKEDDEDEVMIDLDCEA